MSGISGMFNTGRLALSANQKGLETISHNIANVNTPDYSRQEVVLTTTPPVVGAPGQTGTGVQVSEIRRVVNRFIENQVTSGESSYGQLEAEAGLLSRVELAFTDGNGTGLNLSLSQFFAAIQDVSNNPSDTSARSVLLERAKNLSQQFVTTDTQFKQVRIDADQEISGILGEINQFASQIATLNNRIKEMTISGQNPNDLLDERQGLINKVAERIDIQTIEDTFGQVTLFVGNGKTLVEGSIFGSLVGVPGSDNDGFVNISYDPGNVSSRTDITTAIKNGRLKGLLDIRDTTVPSYINRLDQLATGVINEVNQQHGAGYGLDGTTANDFFSPLTPTARALTANTGTGVVTVTVANAALLTFDEYDLSLSGTNYTITNRSTGAASTPGALPQTFEGLTVTLSSGSPIAGDIFRISAHKNSAASMAVSLTDPDKIAAATTAAGTPGDNGNAILMAEIQNKTLSALGSETLQVSYGGIVGDVGIGTRTAQRGLTIETSLREQLKNVRQETSGVSLDEEMAGIIKFQRAYQAAAKIITTADEMFQVILSMKR